MQVPDSDETAPENPSNPEEESKSTNSAVLDDEDEDDDGATADEAESSSSSASASSSSAVLDISGKSLDFLIPENADDAAGALYLYKNVFNLLPKSVGSHKRLRTLKFFGNEINLFSPGAAESAKFGSLECLQVRLSSPEFGGLPLNKLKSLKELELSKVPPRAATFQMLSEIAGLKCLTKLSVCHFSIRYLPPEIGCLENLEYLDLSFNKMKSLPAEISNLNSLVSLKVANNKLVELPSTLSSLQKLENLDLSNNRLTSLGSFQLDQMHNLHNLNLQYNKHLTYCQIPSWICCNLEGNEKDASNDDFASSTVEMDVTPIQKNDEILSHRGVNHSSASLLIGPSMNSRCLTARSSGRLRKREYNLQQRARQERLNNSRKSKGPKLLQLKEDGECKSDNVDHASESCPEGASDFINLDDDGDKNVLSRDGQSGNVHENVAYHDRSLKELYVENIPCVSLDSVRVNNGDKRDCCESEISSTTPQEVVGEEDEGSSSDSSKINSKYKGHSDGHPKRKDRTPSDSENGQREKIMRTEDSSNLSQKYSHTSFCSDKDELSDGFYDAGRGRPFRPLRTYEKSLHLDSREVLLVDRNRDEELYAFYLSAKALVDNFKNPYLLLKDGNLAASSKKSNGLSKDGEGVGALQIAMLLALYVSDHFGGSERGALVERTRNTIASTYDKPFVCTCQTRNVDSGSLSTQSAVGSVEDIVLSNLCERSLRFIKAQQNSIVVPIGSLQFGVCRHRALLLKYLCDRMEPRVPCELVRGYLDFMPHAWNVILIEDGDSKIHRMLVDACHPQDVREETDPEYYYRYIPISRGKVSLSSASSLVPTSSFPTLPFCDGTLNECVKSLIPCKYESDEAVAKIRTLEVRETSMDVIRNFEYNCLGEVRILAALKSPYIVEMYGHRIRSEWVCSVGGGPEHRKLQSEIIMEYIKGGSLQSYLIKLSKAGEKHVPVELALCIAKDVACALVKLHSKHIIHRDIKSENILIDLDRKRVDGTPVVKLCDFDRAVPLRSYLHTCCIAHVGIPPADACVGTPRWMAPEVLRAMHERNIYGLEVDVWSFGCLLLEMLTLQIPYWEFSEMEIQDLLARGKRPKLTDELESLRAVDEPVMTQAGAQLEGTEADLDTLRFLVDLFYQCTEKDPQNRPTADDLYKLLLDHSNTLPKSAT